MKLPEDDAAGHHGRPPAGPIAVNLAHLPAITQATSAAIGSVISSAIVYPLDLVTVRMQTRRLRRIKTIKRPPLNRFSSLASEFSTTSNASAIKRAKDYSTLIGSFKTIITEGEDRSKAAWMIKFYDGILVDSVATLINSFVYFYIYTNLNKLNVKRKKLSQRTIGWLESIVEEILMGSLAGLISKFFTCPLNNITVRLQTGSTSRRSRLQPNISRQSSVDLSGFKCDRIDLDHHQLNQRQNQSRNHNQSKLFHHEPSQFLAESSSDDDDESDSETQKSSSFISRISDTIKSIYEHRGYRGFWSGFGNNCILTLHPSLTLYLTKILKHITNRSPSQFNHDSKRSTSSVNQGTSLSTTFLNSAIASSLSTIIIYPLMLSKTLIQTQKRDHQRVDSSSVHSKRRSDLWIRSRYYGLKSLYTGLSAKLLKVFIGQGITMTIKNQIETIFISLWILFNHHRRRRQRHHL